MKNLILDSHILLWFVNEQEKLSAHILQSIEEADNIYASSITCFEMA